MSAKLTLPAAILGGVLAVIFFFGLGGPRADPGIDRERVVALATAFAEGKQERNGAKACQQLTEVQQREVVAAVEGVPVVDADPRDCQEAILSRGGESPFTQSGDEALLAGAPKVTFASTPAFAAVVTSADGRVSLEAWRRIGEWRLDARARAGVDFAVACQGILATDLSGCGCVFDRARASNPGSPDDFLPAARAALRGDETAAFAAARRACEG